MTHVFVVNETTFNIHLQYLFAGTGYEENDLSCIIDSTASSTEKTLTAMIADISKLRIGDKVLFYVTGCKKIFGIFEVASAPFYEPFLPQKSNYLYDRLEKNLTFRVLIKPDSVYAIGISEHEALDEIHNVEHPYQMCWSLIYRKLSGMRGCAFLTDIESERIIKLIKEKNDRPPLNSNGFKYDFTSQAIVSNDHSLPYEGKKSNSLTIEKRLTEITNSFEVHLQAYITQNFDESLKKILGKTEKIVWIGNEVVCSVGEQKIDVVIICESNKEVIIKIIELKDEIPKAEIIEEQIPWYIKWADQYLAPNFSKEVIIKPIIIAAKFKRRSESQTNFCNSKNRFNNCPPKNHNSKVEKVDYIYFEIDRSEKSIKFSKAD